MTPEEFDHYRNRVANELDCISRHMHMNTEPDQATPVPSPQPSLRKAAVETLVAGELLLSFVERNTDACNRFRKALEKLAEELGK